MNAMLARLEVSSQKQRQFVSDASHELRSPLASIRTNLEVALRHTDSTDWPEVASRVLAEDERMEDTVAELLELARLDESTGPAPIDTLPEVDLDEVVADLTVAPRRVPVDITRVSAGRVHGHHDQLSRAVRNLVSRARHARPPSRGPAPTAAASSPTSTTTAPSPRRPRQVFDPFTRLTTATRKTPGPRPRVGESHRRAQGGDGGTPRWRASHGPALLTPSPPVPSPVPELSVVSFNCHAGLQARRNGACEPYDLAGVLRGFDADVIVVQESFRPDGGVAPAVQVAEELGHTVRLLVAPGRAGPRRTRPGTGWSALITRQPSRQVSHGCRGHRAGDFTPGACAPPKSTSTAPRSTWSACTSRHDCRTGPRSRCAVSLDSCRPGTVTR
jgi:hypothetical protein